MEQVEGTQPQCVIDHPGFYATSLNVYVLQAMYNIYRADHGPVRLRGIEQYVHSLLLPYHKCMTTLHFQQTVLSYFLQG